MLRPSLLLCALALATSSLQAQEFVFKPAVSSSWMRTHQTKVNLEFDSIETTINGQVSSADDMRIKISANNTLQVLDHILAWSPDGKRVFERDYMQVTRDMSAPIEVTLDDKVHSSEAIAMGAGSLQGERFRFEFTPEENQWSRLFVEDLESEEGTTPRPVPALMVDLDMQCLLPPKGTKQGGTWTVDPNVFLGAMMAQHGMEWHFQENQSESLPMWMGSLSHQPEIRNLWQNFSQASVVCELKPRRKAGDLSLYEIQVKVVLHGDCDMSAWVMSSLATQSSGKMDVSVENAFQSTVLQGSGVYLWDTDRRVMHSFRFLGDALFSRSQSMTLQTGDEEMSVQLDCDGRFELDVRCQSQE